MLCAFAIEGDILAQLMWYLLHKTSHQVLRSFRRTPCLHPQPVPSLVQHSCLMSLISRFIRMDELRVVMAKRPDHSGAGSLLAVFRYPRYKAIVESAPSLACDWLQTLCARDTTTVIARPTSAPLRDHHHRVISTPDTHTTCRSTPDRHHGSTEQAGKDGMLRAQSATAILPC